MNEWYTPLRPRRTLAVIAPRPGYIGHAPHLRGRVRKVGPQWVMEVVNNHTGEVIARDDCRLWQVSLDGANAMTGAARGAWTHGLRRKDVL